MIVSLRCGEIARLISLRTESQKLHSIDGSTDKRWEIDKGFMKLENMFLTRLEPVSKGSFQPEIWVRDPTM